MPNTTGTTISGIGHAALIGWVLIGGTFLRPDESQVEKVSEVALITAAQFSALQSVAPRTAVETPEVQAPVAEETPVVATPTDTPIKPKERPAATPEPVAEKTPEPVEPPAPKTEAVVVAPEPPAPPATEDIAVIKPEEATPKPVDRVAPVPAALSVPEAKDDPIKRESTENAPSDTPAKPVEESTAPKEATTEIVTEAEQIKTAPERSVRPKSRPTPPKVAAEPDKPKVDPLQAALTEALAGGETQPETVAPTPSGPPMTGAEKEGLKVAVENCWNVGSLSTDALKVSVTIGFSVGRDGRPDAGSIHQVSSTGGSGVSVNQAFETGRRAIIICGRNGFPLPDDKYEQWRDIEITFNPERMRVK